MSIFTVMIFPCMAICPQSPSIIARESFSIFADVSTPVDGLVITDPEDDFSHVSIIIHVYTLVMRHTSHEAIKISCIPELS